MRFEGLLERHERGELSQAEERRIGEFGRMMRPIGPLVVRELLAYGDTRLRKKFSKSRETSKPSGSPIAS